MGASTVFLLIPLAMGEVFRSGVEVLYRHSLLRFVLNPPHQTLDSNTSICSSNAGGLDVMLDKGDEIHYSILTYIFPTPNLNTNKEMKTNNQNFLKAILVFT